MLQACRCTRERRRRATFEGARTKMCLPPKKLSPFRRRIKKSVHWLPHGSAASGDGLFPSTFRIRPDCRSATSCSVSPSRPAPITTKTTRPSKQNMVGITNTTRAHHILKNIPKIMLLSGGGARSCGSFFAESDPVGSGKLPRKKSIAGCICQCRAIIFFSAAHCPLHLGETHGGGAPC